MASSDSVSAQQNESFSHESRQMDHLFVGDQVELVKDSIVLGQILVFVGLSTSAEHTTVGNDVGAFFGILDGQMGRAPLLKLRTGYEAGWGSLGSRVVGVDPSFVRDGERGAQGSFRLPPVVVVFARDLQNVTNVELYACLAARY